MGNYCLKLVLGERQKKIYHPSLALRASITLARSVSEGWYHLPLALTEHSGSAFLSLATPLRVTAVS